MELELELQFDESRFNAKSYLTAPPSPTPASCRKLCDETNPVDWRGRPTAEKWESLNDNLECKMACRPATPEQDPDSAHPLPAKLGKLLEKASAKMEQIFNTSTSTSTSTSEEPSHVTVHQTLSPPQSADFTPTPTPRIPDISTVGAADLWLTNNGYSLDAHTQRLACLTGDRQCTLEDLIS